MRLSAASSTTGDFSGASHKPPDGASDEVLQRSAFEYIQQAQKQHEDRIDTMLLRFEESVVKAVERSFANNVVHTYSEDPKVSPSFPIYPVTETASQFSPQKSVGNDDGKEDVQNGHQQTNTSAPIFSKSSSEPNTSHIDDAQLYPSGSSRHSAASMQSGQQPISKLDSVVSLFDRPVKKFGSEKTSQSYGANFHEKSTRFSVLAKSMEATRRVSSSKLNFWNERQDKREQKGRKSISRIIHSNQFEYVIIVLIIINGAMIGNQIDWTASYGRDAELPMHLQVLEKAFCVAFTIELLLRLLGYGIYGFIFNKNWKFHLLDTVIVVSAWIEQIFMALEVQSSQNLFAFAALRILRLVRVARSVRLMEFSRDLRNLINGLLHCIKPLFWAIFLLMLITFMFCVILMEFAIDEFTFGDAPDMNVTAGGTMDAASGKVKPRKVLQGDTMTHIGQPFELQWYFGNLPRGMYSLFQAISGGRNWGEIAEPFKHVSWALVIFFAVYVGTVIFAVLNIVTSIFIENARKNNQRDKNNLIWEDIQERNWRVDSLRAIFNNADSDGDGVMSFWEFQQFFEDPILQAFFRTLGLDFETYNPQNVYKLFDVRGDGMIDADGFVATCIHIRGSSKSIDLQLLQLAQMDLETKVKENSTLLQKQLERTQNCENILRTSRAGSGNYKSQAVASRDTFHPPEASQAIGQPGGEATDPDQPAVPGYESYPRPWPTNPVPPLLPLHAL